MKHINCKVCGAPLEIEQHCPINTDELNAPWTGDYEAIAYTKMTHLEHQVSVARWSSHQNEPMTEKKRAKLESLVYENVGRVISTFPLVNEN
ncbi:MAG: hypothetical protein HWE27_11890 [Gammaproteobacteria bacterium]|nr:hypothetical protein [Gammaproteobacteria bacterium]